MDLKHLDIIPEKVEKLFIILHGYSSNKESVVKIAANFLDILPNTAFISIDAPYQCEIGHGFQWFSIDGDLNFAYKETKKTNSILDEFIKRQLKKYNLDQSKLILSGFSQGAIMALFNGLRMEKEPLCLLLFSGLTLDTESTLKLELKSKPKTFLVNGDSDEFIPTKFFTKTEEILNKFNIPLYPNLIQGKNHFVNQECIKLARKFLKNVLNKPEYYPRPKNYEEIDNICISNITNFMNKIGE